ncbi:M56 family peptidase [Fibrisoma montanum]|uniref:M56 family peptidase n=1 Tax=Fibrisoma montanum TaxID=2305895 RepID=A0A418LZS5_9BACT|nr:M56 family metallopeptidase [Fibrisoma montanum]RIV18735.1 M56 family peptidase [Fibrisoma montanum]
MSALDYFLKANLFLLLFYGCYWLLLRRHTFFGLNRMYLLASLVASLALPWIDVPNQASQTLTVNVMTLPTISVGATTESLDLVSLPMLLWLVYGIGVVFMLFQLGRNVWWVHQIINRGQRHSVSTYIGIRLPDDVVSSFSFGPYLVLNRSDALAADEAVLRHEEAHIQQMHTIDVLLVEFMRAAFWFNPVLWLYKRSLQQVHEYLADQAASRLMSSSDYARTLVAYSLNVPVAALTTAFVSISNLKQRIHMLQKPATHRRALLSYAAVLIPATLLWMCTQKDTELTSEKGETIEVNQPARQAGVDGEIYTVVENQPEFTGGMEGLMEYLSKNIRYPAAAERANVQGRVFVNFVVTKEGDIADVKLLKGIGFGADEEAIRVVQKMPRWKPGSQSGEPVNVRFNLPINFQLKAAKPSTGEGQASQSGVKLWIIDGKEYTNEAYQKLNLDPNTIERMDVDKERGVVSITTKE